MRSVFSMTPSTASTKRTIPSQSRRAAVTSSEKLTCPDKWYEYTLFHCFDFGLRNCTLPGVSNIFRRNDFSFKSGMTTVIGVALIETPLSCSVKRVSVYLTGFSSPLPGLPVWRSGCVCIRRQSMKDVLPWCKWPTSATERINSAESMRSAKNSIL